METFRDGIIAEVTGTVARILEYGGDKKASVVEFTLKGMEYPERVTVWGAEYEQGAKVTVRGRFSVQKKVNAESGKTYVNMSLNDAVLLSNAGGSADWLPTHDEAF
jgi:hypothetical protein